MNDDDEAGARAQIRKACVCSDEEIIDIKQNGPEWNQLTSEQIKVCAVLAYYHFTKYSFSQNGKSGLLHENRDLYLGAIRSAELACSLFNVPSETIFQIEDGLIQGLMNLNKIATPGAVYKENYFFNPQHR